MATSVGQCSRGGCVLTGAISSPTSAADSFTSSVPHVYIQHLPGRGVGSTIPPSQLGDKLFQMSHGYSHFSISVLKLYCLMQTHVLDFACASFFLTRWQKERFKSGNKDKGVDLWIHFCAASKWCLERAELEYQHMHVFTVWWIVTDMHRKILSRCKKGKGKVKAGGARYA